MASISRPRANGNWRVEFYIDDKKDGFMVPTKSKTAARNIADMVQRLIDWRKHQVPDGTLFKWLEDLPDEMRQRLEKKGLFERQRLSTIQSAVDAYVDSKRASWKPKTLNRRLNENRWFVEYFKPETRLDKIDRQSAVQFLNWLKDVKNLSPIHINSIMKWGSYIFKYATLCGVYTLPNPFNGVRVPNTVQREKCYITAEYTEKLIDACPTVQWRTLVALLRFGGLRPEEALLAEWDGVDWEAGTFTFRSPKTEHHAGKEQRTIPLFPRLRAALKEMRMWAEEMEGGLVLPRYIISSEKPNNGWDSKRQSIADGKNGSLCELTDFIKKAKLDNPGSVPTNMRGSCSSDLKRKFPEYAVDSWLGHTKEIARRHYDVVTEDLFQRAANDDLFSQKDERCDVRCDIVAINSTTTAKASTSNIDKNFAQTLKKREVPLITKNPCKMLQGSRIPPAGLEPVTR